MRSSRSRALADRYCRIEQMLFRRVTLVVMCLAGITCVAPTSAPPDPLPPAGGVRVLFVGNSLTYVNDLPGTVAAIGASAGETIVVAAAAGPNLALIDHLNGATDAVAQLRERHWEFVILQQGPTPAGLCRDSLVLWTKLYAPLVRGAGATMGVMMSWAGATHQDLFDEVRISFQAASAGVGASFVPAGEAWRAAWRIDPSLALYGGDGFHPSPLGTFLTALVIYERVSGHDARDLPALAFSNGRPMPLPVETVRALQRAAHDSNVQFAPSSFPTGEELARPSVYHSSSSGC
jgi:hypothetical protein